MLAAEKHKATFLAPIGIGLALFIAELSGVCHGMMRLTSGLLYRRLTQPSTIIRTVRRASRIRNLSLVRQQQL